MTRSFSSFISSCVVWFGLVILASLALYHVSDRTQKLDQELRQLNAQIDGERQSLHIIKANYVYLANPERIEKTAKHFLALQPPAPQHIAGLTDIADVLPTRGEALATVAVNNLRHPVPAPQPKTANKSAVRLAAATAVVTPVATPTPAKNGAHDMASVIAHLSAHKVVTKVAATSAPKSHAVAQNTLSHFLPPQPGIPAGAQRTASAVPLPDQIGSFITELGPRP